MIHYVLFGVLGIILSMFGINVIDQPFKFLAIIGIVAAISITSRI